MEGERIVVELEADCYILQNDGDYKVSYSVLGLPAGAAPRRIACPSWPRTCTPSTSWSI